MGAKIQWLNLALDLQIVHKEVLNGPFLRRIREKVLEVVGSGDHRLRRYVDCILCVGWQVIDHKCEASPPLEQEQGPGCRSIADLTPEEAEQVRLHASFGTGLQVQPLLISLELVHLNHHGLNLLIEARRWLPQVNPLNLGQGICNGCVSGFDSRPASN